MPFKKGEGGRPKGAPNKVTAQTREVFQQLIEANHDNLALWVAQVAAEDPEKALNIIIKMAEFVVPKMARIEMTGQDGKDLFNGLRFDFGAPLPAKDWDIEDATIED